MPAGIYFRQINFYPSSKVMAKTIGIYLAGRVYIIFLTAIYKYIALIDK